MRVLAPNLAAGNPVIAKHASIVPHCAETFPLIWCARPAHQMGWTNLVYLRGSGGERLSPTIVCRARR